jgi:hypothetical protein
MTTTDTVRFADATRVVVEASLDTIIADDLDTFAGEQYDAIEDVIRITWHRDTVEFVTVRTLARPWRGEFHIPRSAIERVIY